MYQAIDAVEHKKVGNPTEYIREAKRIATEHHAKTGRHCLVCVTKIIWATSMVSDLDIEGGAV